MRKSTVKLSSSVDFGQLRVDLRNKLAFHNTRNEYNNTVLYKQSNLYKYHLFWTTGLLIDEAVVVPPLIIFTKTEKDAVKTDWDLLNRVDFEKWEWARQKGWYRRKANSFPLLIVIRLITPVFTALMPLRPWGILFWLRTLEVRQLEGAEELSNCCQSTSVIPGLWVHGVGGMRNIFCTKNSDIFVIMLKRTPPTANPELVLYRRIPSDNHFTF